MTPITPESAIPDNAPTHPSTVPTPVAEDDQHQSILYGTQNLQIDLSGAHGAPTVVVLPDNDWRQFREVIGEFQPDNDRVTPPIHTEANIDSLDRVLDTINGALKSAVVGAATTDVRLLDIKLRLDKPEGYPDTDQPVELVIKCLGRYEPPAEPAEGQPVTRKQVPDIKTVDSPEDTANPFPSSGLFTPPKPKPVPVQGIFSEDGTFVKFQPEDTSK